MSGSEVCTVQGALNCTKLKVGAWGYQNGKVRASVTFSPSVRERWYYRYYLSRTVQGALNCTAEVVPVPGNHFLNKNHKENNAYGTGTTSPVQFRAA